MAMFTLAETAMSIKGKAKDRGQRILMESGNRLTRAKRGVQRNPGRKHTIAAGQEVLIGLNHLLMTEVTGRVYLQNKKID